MSDDRKRISLETEVLPRIFTSLPGAFPEFSWRSRRSGGWVATSRAHTKAAFAARPDRVICNEPTGFFVFGQGATHWMAYLNGGAFPTGDAWRRAFNELAARASVVGAVPSLPQQPREPLRSPGQSVLLERLSGAAQRLLRRYPGAAWGYARARGITDDVVFRRQLGFVPNVDEWFREAGVQGRAVSSVRGNLRLPGLWDGRLIAPWRTLTGEPVALWGRRIDGFDDAGVMLEEDGEDLGFGASVGRDRPKYVVAGERPLLYGHDLALAEGGGALTVVEGLMNVLELESTGLRGVVALGGDAAPLELFEALADAGARRVGFVFDGDKAGEAGARRVEHQVVELGGSVDLVVRVACAAVGNPTAADVLG